jgi:probable rRNA maturation factor
MIKIYVSKQSNYPVSTPKLKRKLKELLEKKGIVSDAQVSIAIVGEKKMKELAKKYLKEKDDNVHNVLSFPATEVKEKFIYPPDNIVRLGEIVVCYPMALNEAKRQGKLIDEKVIELVEHGALHLLGMHHE